VIIFGLIRFLSKKVTKPNFFFFKKTEIGSNRPVSVRFFREKTGSNRFGSVFPVLTRFSRFFPVFFGLARFFFRFFVDFGAVRFFWFFVYRTEPAGFLKNLISFFFRFGFFGYFFSSFLGFPVFLLTPN
jgi:hypothetical protein